MIKFLKRRGKFQPSGPLGRRAYAIGDVHGRLDLLLDLLRKIETDNSFRPPAKTFLIMLGDLVDRGPNSRGVIEQMLKDPPAFATPVCLRGNHEEFFENVLEGDEALVTPWLTYGGYECIESYGLSRGWALNCGARGVIDRLVAVVPRAHKDFLASLADSFRFGDYLFVHAGIRPGVPLGQQVGKDLRWIREGFLDNLTDHGVMVVHGHTIVQRPEQHSNRIALDTGAYRTGVLTALGLEGTERWFISTQADNLPVLPSLVTLA